MHFIVVIFVFLLGLAVGSFLNVLVWRVPRNESIGAVRSYCPNCKKELRWYELIPLLSFVWQGGKCRSCHTCISWQYPLVEFTTGVLFVFVTWQRFNDLSIQRFIDLTIQQFNNVAMWQFVNAMIPVLYLWFIVSVLLVIFITDFKYYIIPDKIVFPAIGIAFVYNLFSNFGNLNLDIFSNSGFRNLDFLPFAVHPFWGLIIAGVFASLFFLSLVIASKGRWMGLGDVKFAFLMGFVLGFPNIFVALFLSFTLGSIVGIMLIVARKKSFSSQLPFGTFLTLATFIALFWGDTLFNYYWNVIL